MNPTDTLEDLQKEFEERIKDIQKKLSPEIVDEIFQILALDQEIGNVIADDAEMDTCEKCHTRLICPKCDEMRQISSKKRLHPNR